MCFRFVITFFVPSNAVRIMKCHAVLMTVLKLVGGGWFGSDDCSEAENGIPNETQLHNWNLIDIQAIVSGNKLSIQVQPIFGNDVQLQAYLRTNRCIKNVILALLHDNQWQKGRLIFEKEYDNIVGTHVIDNLLYCTEYQLMFVAQQHANRPNPWFNDITVHEFTTDPNPHRIPSVVFDKTGFTYTRFSITGLDSNCIITSCSIQCTGTKVLLGEFKDQGFCAVKYLSPQTQYQNCNFRLKIHDHWTAHFSLGDFHTKSVQFDVTSSEDTVAVKTEYPVPEVGPFVLLAPDGDMKSVQRLGVPLTTGRVTFHGLTPSTGYKVCVETSNCLMIYDECHNCKDITTSPDQSNPRTPRPEYSTDLPATEEDQQPTDDGLSLALALTVGPAMIFFALLALGIFLKVRRPHIWSKLFSSGPTARQPIRPASTRPQLGRPIHRDEFCSVVKQPSFSVREEYRKLEEHEARFITPRQAKDAARQPSNYRFNRFGNILPYDKNRVVLHNPVADYINASWITGGVKGQRYIAAQGPKDKTTGEHFWRMVIENKIGLIIMLTRIMEKSNGLTVNGFSNVRM